MKTHLLAFGCGITIILALQQFGQQPPSLTPTAQAQDQMEKGARPGKPRTEMPSRALVCNAALLTGGYALALEGPVSSGNVTGPYAGVGVLTFDGTGNVVIRISQSYNGSIQPIVTTAGRYTVNDDCTGTLVLNPNTRFDIVPSNGGREINFLQTNPGNVIYGIARKQ